MPTDLPSLYQIETKVRTGLNSQLPGTNAHLALSPRPRVGWHPGEVPRGARIAAALVLLYPHSHEPHILLTVRAGKLAQHPGQVSFPGGSVNPGETVSEAALREASEEVGVVETSVALLGALSVLYIPVSDFALHPLVGISNTQPSFHAEANEVGRILEIPLSKLISARPHRGYRWRQNKLFKVPFFELGEERVWGATAMVLAELLAIIGTPVLDPF